MGSIVENRSRADGPTELQILHSLDLEYFEDLLAPDAALSQRLSNAQDDTELEFSSFSIPVESQRLSAALDDTELARE